MGWSAEWLAGQLARRSAQTANTEQRRDPDRKPRAPLERECLPAVLEALRLHRFVAWAERINTGGAYFGERFVHFGWVGMADITGQLKDGRRLDVEVKRPGKDASIEQAAYIAMVVACGGCAFVARNADEVFERLAHFERLFGWSS